MAEIPIKPEDVTEEWLKNTLTKTLKKDIEVLKLIPVETEGYLSKACKATVKVDGGIPEKIFLKITLPSDDPFTAFISKYNVDTNEVKAYAETIPKLIDLEKSYRNGYSWLAEIIPKYYAGGADKETEGFFLIMEDLSENHKIVQWNLDLVTLLVSRKTVTKLRVVTKFIAHAYGLSINSKSYAGTKVT